MLYWGKCYFLFLHKRLNFFIRVKNDKSLEKNLQRFFGEDDYEKKNTKNNALFLNMQKDLERAKNKFKRREFNLITGEKY